MNKRSRVKRISSFCMAEEEGVAVATLTDDNAIDDECFEKSNTLPLGRFKFDAPLLAAGYLTKRS